MINFLKETEDLLKKHKKKSTDVLFVSNGSTYVAYEEFVKQADFEYNNGYGRAMINKKLVIVGTNWWIERQEYDGAEWWAFKTIPTKPKRKLKVFNLSETD